MTMYLRKRDVELQIMKQVNRIRRKLYIKNRSTSF